MPGKIHKVIEEIIQKRSNGNQTLVNITRTKLVLKGIDPSKYNSLSADEPDVLNKLQAIANDFGIVINS